MRAIRMLRRLPVPKCIGAAAAGCRTAERSAWNAESGGRPIGESARRRIV